jgi:hypothetical protein
MDAPGSPPTRLTIVPDKWVQPTRRPTDQSVGPTNLVGSPHVCLEDLREDFLDDLVQHDLGGFRPKQIDGIWQDV